MGAGTQTPAITTSALNAESLPSPQIIFMTFFVDDSLVFISNIVASFKNCFSSHRMDIRICIPLSPQIQMSKLVECLKPSFTVFIRQQSLILFHFTILWFSWVLRFTSALYSVILALSFLPLLVLPLCCHAP